MCLCVTVYVHCLCCYPSWMTVYWTGRYLGVPNCLILSSGISVEVSGLKMKCRSFWEGKPKYCWSVNRPFTRWLQAIHGAKIECAILQSVRLYDYMWQKVVCGLSVVFHCRRYWMLLYSLQSYCKNIQKHIPY